MQFRSILILCAAGILGLIAWEALTGRDPLPPLNQAVLDFAQSKTGEQVGNGECWTLADEALRHANCCRPGSRVLGLYQFGQEIEREEGILPGDILQFERVRFDLPNGRWIDVGHHTAIVSYVRGSKLWVLHQNYGHSKIVGEISFDLAHQSRGQLQIFRPMQ